MVVLSGYAAPLYDKRLKGWERIEIPAYADGARPRTEVVWLNASCAAALERERAGTGTPLFPALDAGPTFGDVRIEQAAAEAEAAE